MTRLEKVLEYLNKEIITSILPRYLKGKEDQNDLNSLDKTRNTLQILEHGEWRFYNIIGSDRKLRLK